MSLTLFFLSYQPTENVADCLSLSRTAATASSHAESRQRTVQEMFLFRHLLHWLFASSPFFDDAVRYVPDKYMNMLHSGNRLQCRPILEPHDLLVRTWEILHPINERLLNKVFYLLSGLWGHVASCWFRLQSHLQPDDEMFDS